MKHRRSLTGLMGIAVLYAGAASAWAQVPWSLFAGTDCDLINAANAELVVLEGSRQLVIVSGPDVTLVDTFVSETSDIFLDDGVDLVPVGFISLELDGDGFETLWWVDLTGNVVDVDGFTGEPTFTDLIPSDFFDVPCDACDFWDDVSVCEVFFVDEPPPLDVIIDDTPPVTVQLCGSNITVGMIASLAGLSMLGFVRRRRW